MSRKSVPSAGKKGIRRFNDEHANFTVHEWEIQRAVRVGKTVESKGKLVAEVQWSPCSIDDMALLSAEALKVCSAVQVLGPQSADRSTWNVVVYRIDPSTHAVRSSEVTMSIEELKRDHPNKLLDYYKNLVLDDKWHPMVPRSRSNSQLTRSDQRNESELKVELDEKEETGDVPPTTRDKTRRRSRLSTSTMKSTRHLDTLKEEEPNETSSPSTTTQMQLTDEAIEEEKENETDSTKEHRKLGALLTSTLQRLNAEKAKQLSDAVHKSIAEIGKMD